MAANRPQRISVGFAGGQVLSMRVAQKDLDALGRAIEKGGWHETPSEEGPVRLNLDQLVYLRIDSDERGVGFGA